MKGAGPYGPAFFSMNDAIRDPLEQAVAGRYAAEIAR